jgi:hypothetical protein
MLHLFKRVHVFPAQICSSWFVPLRLKTPDWRIFQAESTLSFTPVQTGACLLPL